MSDEPRDGAAGGGGPDSPDLSRDRDDDGESIANGPGGPAAGDTVSAPWERQRRWSQDPLDATRVDDLLARLGRPDEAPTEGRRRRRQSADGSVSASDLIAALSTDQPTDEPTVFLAPERSAADAAEADQTVLLPPRIGPNDRAPIRDLGDDPRTDFIPKLTGNAADMAEADSIRAALRRQSQLAPGTGMAPYGHGPGGPPPHTEWPPAHGSGQPPRRRLLYAGRSVAAFVAVITLLGVGVEWKIKDRADASLRDHSVAALNAADPNISTARTAPRIITNSQGVTVTESANAATTYAPENILLLGSDTRSGGNAALGGSDPSTDGTANSDTLMVAHISGDRQHVTILSIPRDTIIPAPKCLQWNASTGKYSTTYQPISSGELYHINSSYSVGGPKCSVTAVQSLTGLGITRMIGIDFAGFKAMVDALGGITLNVCAPVVDQELGTVVGTPGVQVVHGEVALGLVRARKVAGETGSDLARIHRQQVILSAILRQVTQAGTLLNPAKLDNFLQAFTRNTFTDNVTLENLVTLAGSLGTLDPAHVTFYTLPTVNSTTIPGALDVDRAKAPIVFDDLINDLPLPGEVTTPATTRAATTPVPPGPSTAAAGSLKLTVAPSQVALEIYNVTGQPNVAGTAQEKLNAIGFKVSDNQLFKPDTGTQTGTTVEYAPTNRAAALTVAAAVRGSTLVVTPGLGSTVRLLLGSTFTGGVSAVTVGQQAPASLSTAISTGPSAGATSPSSKGSATLGSTDLSSVNAAAGSCA